MIILKVLNFELGFALCTLSFALLRQQMVEKDLRARGITNERVLSAFRRVPREEFVPEIFKKEAYADYPLAIGNDQTISQPYVVALMTQAVNPRLTDKVLEIGTGSGYQAAILSLLVKKVYTVERLESLADSAKDRLTRLGFSNIELKIGDGSNGWEERSPFDAILVTAAGPKIPKALKRQLVISGRLIIPVETGFGWQDLRLVIKKGEKNFVEESLGPVAFVPLIGKEGY